jgi:hypothetical protein
VAHKEAGVIGEGRRRYTITLDLKPAQAAAVESLLSVWNVLSGQGGSRWTAFYADGDGDFHPHATFDGHKPEHTKLVPATAFWKNDEYRIDYERIAWEWYPAQPVAHGEARHTVPCLLCGKECCTVEDCSLVGHGDSCELAYDKGWVCSLRCWEFFAAAVDQAIVSPVVAPAAPPVDPETRRIYMAHPDNLRNPALDTPEALREMHGQMQPSPVSAPAACPQCNVYHLESGYCAARHRQGEADMEAGRTRPMGEVLSELREKFAAPPVAEPSEGAQTLRNAAQYIMFRLSDAAKCCTECEERVKRYARAVEAAAYAHDAVIPRADSIPRSAVQKVLNDLERDTHPSWSDYRAALREVRRALLGGTHD